jgi:hypothetical protein
MKLGRTETIDEKTGAKTVTETELDGSRNQDGKLQELGLRTKTTTTQLDGTQAVRDDVQATSDGKTWRRRIVTKTTSIDKNTGAKTETEDDTVGTLNQAGQVEEAVLAKRTVTTNADGSQVLSSTLTAQDRSGRRHTRAAIGATKKNADGSETFIGQDDQQTVMATQDAAGNITGGSLDTATGQVTPFDQPANQVPDPNTPDGQ